MLSQVIGLIVDIGLGALAYGLGVQNRKRLAALTERVARLEVKS